jgi:hypothetical protein
VTLVDVPATFALTPGSRINFENLDTDPRVVGVSDAVRYVLTDAIMSLAGSHGVLGGGISTSLQDKVLSNANLTAPFAQTAYVRE